MARTFARASLWAATHGERVLYRIAGLPIAVAATFYMGSEGSAAALRTMYAANYWRPAELADWMEMLVAGVIWPVGVAGAAAWFAWKNGAVVRNRCGKSRAKQFLEQIRCYFSGGILPPWYYMFELYNGRTDCRSYLNRFETKQGYYPLIRRLRGEISPLNDKIAFEETCRAHQLRTIPVLATASAGKVILLDGARLPPCDLFVKPVFGRGGKGAERWDHDGNGGYVDSANGTLAEGEFLDRLGEKSRVTPLLVQPRISNCDDLGDVNNGALSTIRIVTCLNEQERAEVIAGVMRMAIGNNNRVDNFHAGGIAAAVDIESGRLGSASDLGMDPSLGWIDRHPVTGAEIRGRVVPFWKEACALAERAHRAFPERAVIGWDIAPTEEGPVIVEGNAAPDFDIIQRMEGRGIVNSRVGALLLHHAQAGPREERAVLPA